MAVVAFVGLLAVVSETVRVWLVVGSFAAVVALGGYAVALSGALVFLLVSFGALAGVALLLDRLGLVPYTGRRRWAPDWLLAALFNGVLVWLLYSLVSAAS